MSNMANNAKDMIEKIIEEGKAAFDEGNFIKAKELFLKAVRIAPFRKDIKELLADTLEKTKNISLKETTVKQAKPTPPPEPPAAKIPRPETKDPMSFIPSAPPLKPAPEPQKTVNTPQKESQFYIPGAQIDKARQETFVRSEPAKQLEPEQEETKIQPQQKTTARAKKVTQHKVRNNTKTLMILFLFGFLSFACIAGFLFFGEGIRSALIQIFKMEPPIDPKQKEANQKLFEANSFANQQLYTKAIEMLEEALKIQPPDISAINQRLGELYATYGNNLYNDSKFNEAIEYFEKALKITPKNSEYLTIIAHSYYSIARNDKSNSKSLYSKSIKYYNDASSAAPDNLKIYRDLARTYIAANQQIEAMKIYQKIIDIAPEDDEIAISARKKLESMTGRKIPPKTTVVTTPAAADATPNN